MRYFIIPIVILSLLFAIIFQINSHINKNIYQMLDSLDKCETAADYGRWNECEEYTMELFSRWDDNSDFLALFITHAELDAINALISRFAECVSQQKYFELKVESATLGASIEHLTYLDKLTLANIF